MQRRFYIGVWSVAYVSLVLSIGCGGVPAQSNSDLNTPRKTFVIVHGAWGGGWGFKELASIMRAAGHQVYRPTLTGQGERVHLASPKVGLETHIQDIVNVIEFENLHDVVLVGHSYGGMVITGVADRIPKRLSRIVYVDAHLPNDGESMFDLIGPKRTKDLTNRADKWGDGWRIPPWWPDKKHDVPQQLATFQDSVSVKNPVAAKIPGTYILTLNPGAKTDNFSKSADRARRRGWQYHELRTGHNVQWTMPKELALLLMAED